MRQPPERKRTVAFVDGQNLFFQAKTAFGHTWPRYAFPELAEHLCRAQGWDLVQTRFYTGIPDPARDTRGHGFWAAKLLAMSRRGVHVYSRALRYRERTVTLADGTSGKAFVPEEKGIDVRIAIDVMRLAINGAYDVALLFSQDQDLSELCEEIRAVSTEQDRWLKIACAFPDGPAARNHRGIPRSDWLRIDQQVYETCLDHHDYRRPAPR